MDNRRIPINVGSSVHPSGGASSSSSSEFSSSTMSMPSTVSSSLRQQQPQSVALAGGSDSIRDKMNQRMREFEEESRQWRDQFLSGNTGSFHHHRPRMLLSGAGAGGIGGGGASSDGFPSFGELTAGSPFGTGSLLFGNGGASRLGSAAATFAPFPLTTGSSSASMSSQALQTSAVNKSFIEEDDTGKKRYKCLFEIGDFKPAEIQVRTEGRQLIVRGEREIIAGSSSESKQFNREVTLPDFIEPTSVTSYLSDGLLTVDAPVLLERLGLHGQLAYGVGAAAAYGTAAAAAAASNALSSSSSQSQSQSTTSSSSQRHSPLGVRDTNSPAKQLSVQNSGAPLQPPMAPHQLATPQTFAVNQQQQIQPVVYKFNMSEFRPEDIAITVTDTTLKIHALREETESGGKTYREFKREIGLPQGSDVKRLKNSLQTDGQLIIEIPVLDNSGLRPPLTPAVGGAAAAAHMLGKMSLNESSSSASSSSVQQQQQQQMQLQQQQHSALTEHGNRDMRLAFDLTGYKPEDLTIKVIDNNILKVHAVHIDNTRGNQIHREYTR